MNSRAIDITVLVLIIIYTILVFVTISIDDCNSDLNTQNVLLNLKYLEIAIISTFFIEIFLKVIGVGIKVFHLTKIKS